MKSTKTLIVRDASELAAALGLSTAQGAEIEARSALCDKLISVATREHLTHAEIARVAGTSRTRVTAILNLNLNGVSIDLLLRILGALGYRAKINLTKIKPAA
jgi:predicted XRE-type DNA-binding protein